MEQEKQIKQLTKEKLQLQYLMNYTLIHHDLIEKKMNATGQEYFEIKIPIGRVKHEGVEELIKFGVCQSTNLFLDENLFNDLTFT